MARPLCLARRPTSHPNGSPRSSAAAAPDVRVVRPIPVRTGPIRGPGAPDSSSSSVTRAAAPTGPTGLLETAYAVLDDYLEEGRAYAEGRRARSEAALAAARGGSPHAAAAAAGTEEVMELLRQAAMSGLGTLAPTLGRFARTTADVMSGRIESSPRPQVPSRDAWPSRDPFQEPGFFGPTPGGRLNSDPIGPRAASPSDLRPDVPANPTSSASASGYRFQPRQRGPDPDSADTQRGAPPPNLDRPGEQRSEPNPAGIEGPFDPPTR